MFASLEDWLRLSQCKGLNLFSYPLVFCLNLLDFFAVKCLFVAWMKRESIMTLISDSQFWLLARKSVSTSLFPLFAHSLQSQFWLVEAWFVRKGKGKCGLATRLPPNWAPSAGLSVKEIKWGNFLNNCKHCKECKTALSLAMVNGDGQWQWFKQGHLGENGTLQNVEIVNGCVARVKRQKVGQSLRLVETLYSIG